MWVQLQETPLVKQPPQQPMLCTMKHVEPDDKQFEQGTHLKPQVLMKTDFNSWYSLLLWDFLDFLIRPDIVSA